MKRVIAAFIAGVALASGTAVAATQAWGQQAGYTCTMFPNQAMGCVRTNGDGYAVAMNRRVIFIVDDNGKRVFTRYQP